MQTGNRAKITICGKEYTLVSQETSAYLEKVGTYVDGEMDRVMKSGKIGVLDAAVLAAVNITDQLFKEQASCAELRSKIKQTLDDAGAAQKEVSELKREVFRLNQQLEKAEKARK